MSNILREIFDWAEVWALFIPLVVMIRTKKSIAYLVPVRWFVGICLLLNIAINLIWKFKDNWHQGPGDILYSNNFIYNIESIIRLLLFSWFFILLKQRFMHRIKLVIPFGFIVFVLINFIFFENFFAQQHLSSRLLATEAALILFYCLQYFIYIIIDDKGAKLTTQPGFWIVTGLIIYVAVNFFIFLFYSSLSETSSDAKLEFAEKLWDAHNVVLINLCIFIAIQLSRTNDK